MISIIIPVFNRLQVLRRCIDSVISQAYDGLELIIVDDFSQDSTEEYLLQLANQYSFVKIYLNYKNYGVNYSRNRGIELASKEFILFLDSDDQLEKGSLSKIINVLAANPETKHFLFIVSDRGNEFKYVKKPISIQYQDWVSAKISGDFTHVICAQTMKKYLFFEEFRMFEHLNWLRVKKETSPQLLVPLVTTQRERNRSDSLTLSSRLKTFSGIQSKFESEKLFYSMYHDDLSLYNPRSLSFKLVKTIFLGVACDQKSDCKVLILYAKRPHIKLLGNLIILIPSFLLKYGIIKYCDIKRKYAIKSVSFVYS